MYVRMTETEGIGPRELARVGSVNKSMRSVALARATSIVQVQITAANCLLAQTFVYAANLTRGRPPTSFVLAVGAQCVWCLVYLMWRMAGVSLVSRFVFLVCAAEWRVQAAQNTAGALCM